MQGRLLAVFALAMLLVLPRTEAGWGVVAAKVVQAVVCNHVCKDVCDGRGQNCHPVCSTVCSYVGRKKRDTRFALDDEDGEQVVDDEKYSSAFMSSLKSYDKNGDGRISRKEFVEAGGGKADRGSREAFMLSDRNGDRLIDCQEFKKAPLVFSQKPKC